MGSLIERRWVREYRRVDHTGTNDFVLGHPIDSGVAGRTTGGESVGSGGCAVRAVAVANRQRTMEDSFSSGRVEWPGATGLGGLAGVAGFALRCPISSSRAREARRTRRDWAGGPRSAVSAVALGVGEHRGGASRVAHVVGPVSLSGGTEFGGAKFEVSGLRQGGGTAGGFGMAFGGATPGMLRIDWSAGTPRSGRVGWGGWSMACAS